MASGLLVSFSGFPVALSSLFADNGLASLAGTLLAHGHEVRVLDFNTVATARRLTSPELTARLQALLPALAQKPDPELLWQLWQLAAESEALLQRTVTQLLEELSAKVQALRAQFVGFKLWSGLGLLAVSRLAAGLRQRFPELRLYGGGPAVLYAGEVIYDLCPDLEVLVEGEGELALLGLAAYAEQRGGLEEVPNLILRRAGQVLRTPRRLVENLESLAPPAYDPAIYPSLVGNEQIKLLILDESRGCPLSCAFCNHRSASGTSWRLSSSERLLADLERFAQLFGTRAFRLGGSYASPRLLATLAGALSGARQTPFCGFAHPLSLGPRHLEALAAAGCQALFFGVESFAGADSAVLGKRLDPARARQTIRWCQEQDIFPVISIIMPLPRQSAEGQRCNRESLLELCAGGRGSAVTQIPGLMPRSAWWEDPERYGFSLEIPRRDFLRLVAAYPIRHIIPAHLWPPLPYTVDGRNFADYASVNGKFQQELQQRGVLINAADDTALIARVMGGSVAELQRRLRTALFTCDSEALAALVAAANAALAGRRAVVSEEDRRSATSGQGANRARVTKERLGELALAAERGAAPGGRRC